MRSIPGERLSICLGYDTFIRKGIPLVLSKDGVSMVIDGGKCEGSLSKSREFIGRNLPYHE